MMRKVIAAGHICLDITPVFPDGRSWSQIGDLLVPGKLVHVERAEVHSGGSVANTGLALKALGVDVTLMGKVGHDAFGMLLEQLLAEHGASGLIRDPGVSTSYSVVLAVPGIDRIFLHDPGANDTFSQSDIPEEALSDAVLFHFGYPPLMRRMYLDGGAELISLFRRIKDLGIATSLDLAAVDPLSEAGRADWEEILSGVLPYTDFFAPSFEELCFMLDRERYLYLAAQGRDISELMDVEADVIPLGHSVLAMGCKAVLIKCGTAGIYYCTAEKSLMEEVGSRLELDAGLWAGAEGLQPCFRADAVRSGTGAGDTAIAAFLAGVLSGRSPAGCAALAAAEGACCVTAYDALSGLKSIEYLEDRINAGWESQGGG